MLAVSQTGISIPARNALPFYGVFRPYGITPAGSAGSEFALELERMGEGEAVLAKSIYHAAYHCNNMQETLDFYTKIVGLDYVAALRADHDPITGKPCDFIHTFFELEDGSAMAFFEVASEAPQPSDPILQHFAIVVADRAAFDEAQRRLDAFGVDYTGPVDHKATLSLYFFDPTGHQVEFALPLDPAIRQAQAQTKWQTLEAWNRKYHPELVAAK